MPDPRIRSERDDLAGLPERQLSTLYLRRRFVGYDDHGAEEAVWAEATITGRITRGNPSTVGGAERDADLSLAKLLTNSGAVVSGDELTDQAGWDVLPLASRRERWQVTGDPYAVPGMGGLPHHYEVPLRRVEG